MECWDWYTLENQTNSITKKRDADIPVVITYLGEVCCVVLRGHCSVDIANADAEGE